MAELITTSTRSAKRDPVSGRREDIRCTGSPDAAGRTRPAEPIGFFAAVHHVDRSS
jgi:hypothetical protein